MGSDGHGKTHAQRARRRARRVPASRGHKATIVLTTAARPAATSTARSSADAVITETAARTAASSGSRDQNCTGSSCWDHLGLRPVPRRSGHLLEHGARPGRQMTIRPPARLDGGAPPDGRSGGAPRVGAPRGPQVRGTAREHVLEGHLDDREVHSPVAEIAEHGEDPPVIETRNGEHEGVRWKGPRGKHLRSFHA